MSENLDTVLFFSCFFVGVKLVQKETILRWAALGVLIGFSPVVKAQNTIMLVLLCGIFAIHTVWALISKRNLFKSWKHLCTPAVSILVFFIFSVLIFSNIAVNGTFGLSEGTGYGELIDLYRETIKTAFSDLRAFILLVQVSFAQVAYIFLFVGIMPLTALIELPEGGIQTKIPLIKDILEMKGHIVFLSIFAILVIIVNLGVSIVHALWASLHYDDFVTLYGRYIDMFAPPIFLCGMVRIVKAGVRAFSVKRLLFCLSICILIIAFFYDTHMKLSNNPSLYGIFHAFELYGMNWYLLFTAFVLLATILCVVPLCAKDKINSNRNTLRSIITFTLIGVWVVFLNAASIDIQSKTSKILTEVYSTSYYFKQNNIQGADIILDYTMWYNADRCEQTAEQILVTSVMTRFWTTHFNRYIRSSPGGAVSRETYYITDRVLPHKYLGNSGGGGMFFRHDETDVFVFDYLPLFFASKNTILQSDFFWMDGGYSSFRTYIPDAARYQITLLEGGWPIGLSRTVTVKVNGREIGTVTGESGFSFIGETLPHEVIEDIEIFSSVWDPHTETYAEEGVTGLGLAMIGIEFAYLERYSPVWTIESNYVALHSRELNGVSLTPEILFPLSAGRRILEDGVLHIDGRSIAFDASIPVGLLSEFVVKVSHADLWPTGLERNVELSAHMRNGTVNAQLLGQHDNAYFFLVRMINTPRNIFTVTISSDTWDPDTGDYSTRHSARILGLDIASIEIMNVEEYEIEWSLR
jgi:hypothetical protein